MQTETHEALFLAAYEKLNAEQRKAVDTTEGPVMVIAGPGTGKTQILTLRIANILRQTDTKPENILALTFTDAGAHAMRTRLASFIGNAAYHVPIHTFHSFAGECIRNHPDAYPKIVGARAATDIERLSILQDIIDSGEYRLLRPSGYPQMYVKKLPGAISDLKKEYMDPDALAKRIDELESELEDMPKIHEKGAHKGKPRRDYLDAEKRIARLREVCSVYRAYEAAMREARLYDFDDMILETVHALKTDEGMLRDVQETYQYVLADEHQDVNEAQNKILDLLAGYHDTPNLFVVGDEKQAIYRFQGASLDNFLFFEDRFSGAETISLTQNYRSTQNILDAAHSLIETDDPDLARLRVPLESAAKGSGALEVRQFTHTAVEDEWLIDAICAEREQGTEDADIAVILRNNREVAHVTALLRAAGVPVRPSAESDILEHPVTHTVESLLTAVLYPENERALFNTLHSGFWGISSADLARIFAAQSRSQKLTDLVRNIDALEKCGVSDMQSVTRVGEILDTARNRADSETPHYTLQWLIEESGLLKQLMEQNALESVRVLRRLYDDIEAMVVHDSKVTLRAVVDQIAYRREHGLSLTAPFIGNDATAVQVMTAHKSKGLEFETVCIPYVMDAFWGKSGKRNDLKLPLMKHDPHEAYDDEDDERRLFYVAMTRAKSKLLLSWSETNTDARQFSVSRFIESIDDAYLDTVSTEERGDSFDPALRIQSSHRPLPLDADFVREEFLARGFAVTHLNNYLEDPWKYVYENILRIPRPKTLSAHFGTTVHEVLERVVREGHIGDTAVLPKLLDAALAKVPVGAHEYPALHERALDALVAFMPNLAEQANEHSRSEMSVTATLETGDADLPEVTLTGNFDRVDYAADGRILRVVDYKTGKAKSRNEVEGNTKNSNGNYKRQLVFYALLLRLSRPDEPLPEAFSITYVEPKDNGTFVEHSFGVSEEEIDELKAEVIRVAKEITSGAFLDTAPAEDAPYIPLGLQNHCATVEKL